MLVSANQVAACRFSSGNIIAKIIICHQSGKDELNAAFERVLETFQIENLKDLRREALEKLVSGLDVFVIQPTGSGKSLNFSVSPDCVRHSKTVLKCEINRPCDFSSGLS